MSKDSKRLINSKYFKWGLTAFLVIVFSILFLFTVYNMDTVSQGVSKVFNVIMPIIIGIVIAYLINPIMRFIEVDLIEKNIEKSGKTITKKAHTRHRVEALVLAFVIISYLVFAFFKSVVPELINSIRSIISHFDTYYNNVVNLLHSIIAKNGILAENDITNFINEHSEDISSFFILHALSTLIKVISLWLEGDDNKYISASFFDKSAKDIKSGSALKQVLYSSNQALYEFIGPTINTESQILFSLK